ncbi:MAG: phosphoglycolate phosphatase [Rhodobacteraceae bacterium]|nr:phosphoglycolate phosphatase [Paracoccaceae bacterium]
MAKLALIFDLDGTLIDSAPEIHAAANRALAIEGLPPLTFAQVRSFIGNGVAVLLARCLQAHGQPDHGAQLDRMKASFIADYEMQFSLTTLYPGVTDMLQTFAKLGHPMAICTNKPEAPTRAVLRHFNLLQHFPVIIGGDTLPQRKPDPAPLRATLAALHTTHALFVGDSEVDAETAHATPLPLALFTGGYRSRAVADLAPRFAFDHHDDLRRLLTQTKGAAEIFSG